MNSRLGILAMLSFFLIGAACATTGGTGSTAGIGPKVITPASPSFDASAGEFPRGAVDVEVWIDSFGKPDLRTLKFTGGTTVGFENAVKRWLSIATFQPATQSGEPTRGLYKLHYSKPQIRTRTRG